MATVLAAPRSAVSSPRPRVPRARRPGFDTPTALTGLLTLLAVLCVLAGTLGAVVAARSAGAARTLAASTVPAEVDAATIYTNVADADATAATAFLAGGVEPADLRSAYLADIAKTGTAIASIGAPPAGSRAAAALADLTAELPVYTGLIETARANNRQGFPVGGAYLSSASALARSTVLKDADTLLTYEQSRVSAGYADSRSSGTTALLFIALAILGIVLVLGQLVLTRRTKRVVNLPLALATLLVLISIIVSVAVVTSARSRLNQGANASAQIALLTTAQIDALEEKGDESLELVGRGDDDRETEFTAAATDLTGVNGVINRAQDASFDQTDVQRLRDAAVQEAGFVADHAAVTAANAKGDFVGSAAAQATGDKPFKLLVGNLQMVSTDSESTFHQQVTGVTGPLDALAVVVPILSALALLLSGFGIRLRLREFR